MEILLDKKSETDAIIKVAIKEADYASSLENKIKDYSKKVSLKGFRPGKAPIGMVRKMVGTSMKFEEISKMAYASVKEYLQNEKLEIIGEPLPLPLEGVDVELDVNFEFDFQIGVVPAYNFSLTEGLSINRYEVEITSEAVEALILNLQNRMATFPEREISDAKSFLTGKLTNGELSNENAVLKIEELKENAKNLFVDKKIGDVVTFTFEDTFEGNVKSRLFNTENPVSGQTVLEITRINEIQPHEINQEFFDKTFGQGHVNSEVELREKIRTILENDYKKAAEDRKVYDLRNALLKNTNIQISRDFAKRWIKANNEKVSEEQIDKEIELIENEFRWNIIKGRFANESEIKLNEEDLMEEGKAEVVRLLGENGMDPDNIPSEDMVKIVKDYMTREKGKHYQDYHIRATDKKITTKMFEVVNFVDKKVTKEEFDAILD